MSPFGATFGLMALSKNELDNFERALEEAKKNILYQLGELEKQADFGNETDSGEEEADESEEFSNQLDLQKNLKARLADIETALGKIKKGTYGACEKCGKQIEGEILKIDPESRHCKTCKLRL